MKSYKELLERAQQKLPQEKGSGERFEVPKINVYVARRARRTFVNNFREISSALNRDPQHLMKFLTNEMATAGSIDGTKATFQGRFMRDTLKRLLGKYIDNFVTCPVCKRPDTKIAKEKRFFFLECDACGARSSVRSV
jgi:translation initiation factor 2 subunit 2